MAEAVKKEDVKPKGPLGKLKETIDDKDEQMAFLSTIIYSWFDCLCENISADNQPDIPPPTITNFIYQIHFPLPYIEEKQFRDGFLYLL